MRQALSLALFLLLLVSGCVTTRPEKVEVRKLKIAILDFSNESRSSSRGLGKFFADRLTHELFRQERYEIVERGEIAAVLAAEKIDKAFDLLSTQDTKHIGTKLDADVLIVGVVTEYKQGNIEEGPSRVGLLVKAVSCKDGHLVGMENIRKKGKGDVVSLSEGTTAEAAGRLIKPLDKETKAFLHASQEGQDSLFVPVGMGRGK